MVVMAQPVVVTHRGIGWRSRAREHGNCNCGKQYVPEDSHNVWHPFANRDAAFDLRAAFDACSMPRTRLWGTGIFHEDVPNWIPPFSASKGSGFNRRLMFPTQPALIPATELL